MPTANLILKGKWYDMIQSGEKKEEYREPSSYWSKRIFRPWIDHVTFHRGYTNKRRMTFKIEKSYLGEGRPEWGAEPGKQYIVLRLGEKIDDINQK
jgi:hypothetical protein